MNPSIKQLKYLCAVAEHRHFSKAAEACHVTQSTLSAAIQELESQLGAKIFERNKKTVLITSLGEKLLAQALQLLRIGGSGGSLALAGRLGQGRLQVLNAGRLVRQGRHLPAG